jgi:hypothetical protein
MSTLAAENARTTRDLETYSIKGAGFLFLQRTVIFTRSPTLLDGLKVIERFFTVPLDHAKPEGDKIRIFARHIIPKDKAKTPEDEAKLPFRECQSTEPTS